MYSLLPLPEWDELTWIYHHWPSTGSEKEIFEKLPHQSLDICSVILEKKFTSKFPPTVCFWTLKQLPRDGNPLHGCIGEGGCSPTFNPTFKKCYVSSFKSCPRMFCVKFGWNSHFRSMKLIHVLLVLLSPIEYSRTYFKEK